VDNLAISVRRATPDDAVALAELVNRAYGVESFFVEGDRTTAVEVAELTRSGAFLVLEHGQGIAAAIYLERRGSAAYVGLLSVDPALQGMGLGTRLVRIAEAMSEAMGATHMTLKIVNLREELERWYKGLGYRPIGTAPYEDAGLKRPCHFVEMHKYLGSDVVDSASLGAA
jgi:ribosomal protein S18 acetylase RimI-like enzyme